MLLNRISTLPELIFNFLSLLSSQKARSHMYWLGARAIELFRELTPLHDTGTPPVALLRETASLERLSNDPTYVARVEKSCAKPGCLSGSARP